MFYTLRASLELGGAVAAAAAAIPATLFFPRFHSSVFI